MTFSTLTVVLRNTIVEKMVGGKFDINKSSVRSVRALSNVNLEVNPGDRVGLIGHNGSGKSTLLRVIAGIYPPTIGHVEVNGKISTLFGTTIVSNNEMTGYENMFLNSLIFTGDYKRTKEQMEEMAEFTELGEYLSLPMNTYSDGMKVRVAFASATNIIPDILLIDEVFGAGDKHFSEKSSARMASLIDQSNTLFLASHSDALIRKFCNKALYLEHGVVTDFGNLEAILNTYNKCA